MNQIKRKTAVLTASRIAAMSTHALAAGSRSSIDPFAKQPSAKDGTKKNGKNTQAKDLNPVSVISQDLAGKAQAKAKQAIDEANSFAKAAVAKSGTKVLVAGTNEKPVADITHRESGLGTYTAPVFKTPAKSKGLGSHGARAVGAHAA